MNKNSKFSMLLWFEMFSDVFFIIDFGVSQTSGVNIVH